MRLDRAKIEAIMNASQLRLETRERIWGGVNDPYELFIAAGESKPPHFRYRRFGIEPTDFPFGCFVTMTWLLKDENQMVLGIPAFYDKSHNPELDEASKKLARINRCKADAADFLKKRNKARTKKKSRIIH